MYYDLNFKKSLILMYNQYNKYNMSIKTFIVIIKEVFSISKTTFYRWLKNAEIIDFKIKNNIRVNNKFHIYFFVYIKQ